MSLKYIATLIAAPEVRITDQKLVAAYLEAGSTLIVAAGLDLDELDPSCGEVVPIGVASDGTLAWSIGLSYYVRNHGVVPPDELLAHIRAQDYNQPQLDQPRIEALRLELLALSTAIEVRPDDSIPDSATEASDELWLGSG